jgi:hypothetical protein
MGHALMENRHGLLVDGRVSEANGTAERDAAAAMAAEVPGRHRITVAGDKGFDTAGFVTAMRELNVTPHVAQNTAGRCSAIDNRTTRHPGYAVSQRIRKRIEEAFALGGLLTAGPPDIGSSASWRMMDQRDRPAAPHPAPRQSPYRLAVHPRSCRLRPDPTAEAARRANVNPGSHARPRAGLSKKERAASSATRAGAKPAAHPLFPRPARAGTARTPRPA